jgi:DNA-binding LacI/PurR family transcriptional regulator
MASTRKIAKEAGVSVGTVSRVLNNKSGVGEETRRRVMEVAKDLNYAPAKRMPLPMVNVTHIGLLVRPLGESLTASPFYADVYHGVEQACSEMRINLAMGSLALVDDMVRSLPTLVDDDRVGGLILIGALSAAAIEQLAGVSQLPLVLVDNWIAGSQWDSVMLDNSGGTAQATARLIELGHQHIAFVGGPNHPSIVERLDGYQQTMLRRQLVPRVVRTPELTVDDGERAGAEILQLYPQTTAIVCSNDLQALGVIRRVMRAGRQVPGDISVVGFDDIAMASLTYPPLTTVAVNRNAFGRLAVELLMGRIGSPSRPPVRCTMGVALVERASVDAPRRRVRTPALAADGQA